MKKAQAIIKVKGLHFAYGESPILRGINFRLHEGEVLGVVGASGSGKTSLMKVLAGLLEPLKGELLFDGQSIEGPSSKLIPGHDKIKLVHQDFDLMPYLSLRDNLLKNSLSQSMSRRQKTLNAYKKHLKLKGVVDQKAAQTSGGQKQRVALATALGASPDVLLLDEPFSNLDYPLKRELMHLLLTEWRPRAMILVTHEPSDVLEMADRIMVLSKGRIVQIGEKKEVYENPKNHAIGRVLGLLNTLSEEQQEALNVSDLNYLRPHQLQISDKGAHARVRYCGFQGGHYLLELETKAEGEPLFLHTSMPYEVGSNVRLKYNQP